MIDKICTEIMDDSGPYMQYIERKVPEQYRDDLIQEVMMILLKDTDKLQKAYTEKWLTYLWVNICGKQINSVSSPFYRNFRQQNSEFNENIHNVGNTDIADKEQLELQWELTKLVRTQVKHSWLESEIIAAYYDTPNATLATVAEQYDLTIGTVFNIIHRVLARYRKAIENEITLK